MYVVPPVCWKQLEYVHVLYFPIFWSLHKQKHVGVHIFLVFLWPDAGGNLEQSGVIVKKKKKKIWFEQIGYQEE